MAKSSSRRARPRGSRDRGRVEIEVRVDERHPVALRRERTGFDGVALAEVPVVVDDADRLSLRLSSNRSAVPSIEPSETTMNSISSPGSPPRRRAGSARRSRRSRRRRCRRARRPSGAGPNRGRSETEAATAPPGDALGSLTAAILGALVGSKPSEQGNPETRHVTGFQHGCETIVYRVDRGLVLRGSEVKGRAVRSPRESRCGPP